MFSEKELSPVNYLPENDFPSFCHELFSNSWIEIDLKNFQNNLLVLKKMLKPKTLLMAVVKADAYGHGYTEMSKFAQKNGADYLGVASVFEGKLLRNEGIKIPILVLGNIFPLQIEIALENNLDIVVSSIESVLLIQEFAQKKGFIANVHLKIDTGMGRVGVIPENLDRVLEKLLLAKNIFLKGVFTHFSDAENLEKSYTLGQLSIFHESLVKIKEKGFKNFITHAANSSATILYPDSHFDLVRTGIAMYGYPEPKNDSFKPVLSLKTKIIAIKEFKSGCYLGYGKTFLTKRKSIIATLPIGYADGLSRLLSNRQEVIIKQTRCPIVGNISMDQALVDITELPDLKVGETVILIGYSGKESITAKEWADKIGTISYEVLCNFGNRIPRFYLNK